MQQNDIKRIIGLIKEKKPLGFELLYTQYFRFLFSISYSVLNNENDSYDVIQNLMMRLYMLDEKLFPVDHELSWLKTVVKNEALMQLRKEKPTVPLEDSFEFPMQDQRIEDFVDMESFHTLTSSLNEKQKKIVTMKVLGNMTHKEISKVLSIPIGTVQWIYNTSIKKLRRTLSTLTSFILVFGGGFGYQLYRYFSSAAEQPGGDVGISAIPSQSPVLSPWLVVFFVMFSLSLIAWVLFFKYSDRCQQSKAQLASNSMEAQ